jgi:4a-hydroxytetrahydrobiopterin dehydratase
MEKPTPLPEEEIRTRLKDLSGWSYEDNKLKKEFKFSDFMDSLGFINKMAPYFEKMDHHPDTHIFYNKILFELQRFDIGGKVTEKDFEVVSEIERVYAEK